ncbi:MAG TPA: SDR family NAD(P)-dependent oxidoreductase [Ktedonobacterales bacterium]|nr:SDR family NAD(P)-dependent oxidoreductase [Ktedonobacterales bacterium]
MGVRYVAPSGGAVVVGASSGIGAEVARELARRGYRVALIARRVEDLEILAAAITSAQGGDIVRVYPFDVRDYLAAVPLFEHITADMEEAGAPLRLLVYSAGVMPPPGPGGWSFGDQRAMIEVNLLGAIRWLDLAAAYFAPRKTGAIVGISSVAGDRGRKGNSAYMASKAGMSVYLESLRYRLASARVRVVTIKPGFVDTPMIADAETPRALTAAPGAVARRIADAATRGPEVVYTPWYWGVILRLVKLLPAGVMKRLAG